MTHEDNWFWLQGYHDGLDDLRATAPDEARYSFQRNDYFDGYKTGLMMRIDQKHGDITRLLPTKREISYR